MQLFKSPVLNGGSFTEVYPSVFHSTGALLGPRDCGCSPTPVPRWCGSKLQSRRCSRDSSCWGRVISGRLGLLCLCLTCSGLTGPCFSWLPEDSSKRQNPFSFNLCLLPGLKGSGAWTQVKPGQLLSYLGCSWPRMYKISGNS